uniref:protein-tyrosine-phosphatase n=1 Tax=Parascaris univalens TaxID=6257 RepID=A0A915C0X9_PARUN
MDTLRSVIFWLWWICLIFLLLRRTVDGFTVVKGGNSLLSWRFKREYTNETDAKSASVKPNEPIMLPKTPQELKIPQCDDSMGDCAYGGKCVTGPNGYKSCLCPASCPVSIPVSCRAEKHDDYCLSMSDDYREKFLLPEPACHMGICVCPPMFDPWKMEGSVKLLPFKCDRRELRVQGVALPSDSVYQGTDAMLFCCINMDPRTFVNEDGVDFIQNSSIIREPTSTPYHEIFTDGFEPPRCWSLDIKNAQFSDSGSYLCHVKTVGRHEILANFTIEFVVKAPRMIQNVTVKANATHAEVFWDTQEGPMLKIEFRLVRRTDGVEVWAQRNAKPGVLIEDLLPATPYTLFISVYDGQNDPFKITEQFTTSESAPDPPTLGEIRLLNLRDGIKCEVEWTPPKTPNGRITKYYVTVRGSVRYVSPGGTLSNDDFPAAERDRCANYNGDEKGFTSADAIADFYSCRFGPLKPNRNYTATVWAENGAGRSKAVVFSEQCVTNYAQPDTVDPPASLSQNGTAFGLSFNSEPDETNGPVACYYVAVVPLSPDVAIESLPPPDSLVVDTFVKAINNNLHEEHITQITNGRKPRNRRYFAYIAESYMQLPRRTYVGDGNTTAGVEPCNVLYLSRHKPEDPALRPGFKYTGFLIVRVDRDDSVREEILRQSDPFFSRRKRRRLHYPSSERRYTERSRWFSYREESEFNGRSRAMRQLIISGPAYGFSSYFKPVLLQPNDGSVGQSWISLFFIVLSLLLFMLLVSSTVVYVLHKRGMIKQLCPVKKDRVLLKPLFHATPVEDLPNEFVIRHRDSNFLFISEFEALPHYQKAFESLASERRENSHKNRYNDIKAFDATRVKLSQIGGDTSSDYINANFIKGYKGRKTFIATQGPVDASVDDFWRMIWEHNVSVIVMVANLFERSRSQCSKYWPDDAPKLYDRLEVRPVGSTYYSDYAVRIFEVRRPQKVLANGSTSGQPTVVSYETINASGFNIDPTAVTVNISRPSSMRASQESILNSGYLNVSKANGDSTLGSRMSISVTAGRDIESGATSDVRRVTQYHYTSWNDLQAPECTTGLLRFLLKLRKLHDYNNSPVVVHCSAGVGRTGTFIAVDGLLDQCIEEGKADVFGFVSEMRKQRNIMVQNYEQYVFIYKALAEWYMFGETDIDMQQVHEHYRQLKEPYRERHPSANSSSNISAIAAAMLRSTPKVARVNGDLSSEKGVTGMELEFKRLDRSLDLNRTCDFAHKQENMSKNRFDNAVPYDQCRVVLSIVVGSVTDTTYINASLVKGYFYPYILAQDPTSEQTCYDFWRMIGDQNSKALVMLSNEDDFSDCEKYWPSEIGRSVSFGPGGDVSVKLVSEEVFPSFILKKLTYKFAKEKMYREVVQFDYSCWPTGSAVPTSTDSLIDLISRVLSLQSDHQEAGPIVLHSRDGSSETGVFCCVSLLLERLKAEHRIDVFQTVRSLQQNRPLMFKRLEQYEFCYRTVVDYLDSFNDNGVLC